MKKLKTVDPSNMYDYHESDILDDPSHTPISMENSSKCMDEDSKM